MHVQSVTVCPKILAIALFADALRLAMYVRCVVAVVLGRSSIESVNAG